MSFTSLVNWRQITSIKVIKDKLAITDFGHHILFSEIKIYIKNQFFIFGQSQKIYMNSRKIW